MIFVFGSNESGIHGAGAAKFAVDKHKAQWGKGYGHYGNSFAIPTRDEYIETLPIDRIAPYVMGFLAYARGKRKVKFKITRIGCGLAGFTDAEIAPLFMNAPNNCYFDELWEPYLGTDYNYWGTHP